MSRQPLTLTEHQAVLDLMVGTNLTMITAFAQIGRPYMDVLIRDEDRLRAKLVLCPACDRWALKSDVYLNRCGSCRQAEVVKAAMN